MSAALSDVRVIDFGQVYLGPYCSMLMAHLGADVIKIEPFDGEPTRYRGQRQETHEFCMLNTNKRSLALDLKHPDGVRLARALANECDVLIENFAPGAMDRLGLGAAELCAANSRLIYATGKGYGSSGPYADLAAMDITVQAMSGAISLTGFPDGPPVKCGPAFVDFSAGVHLFGAIVAALYQRERTGLGQVVEVSMHDVVYPMLASALGGIYNHPNRSLPERTGNHHAGLGIAPYNVYPASDGWLAIICMSDRHWQQICAAMGRDELGTDPGYATRGARARAMQEIDELVSAWTMQRTRWEAVRALQDKGVPSAPVLTVREVSEDRHLIERGTIRSVEHPVRGDVRVPTTAMRLSASPPDIEAAPLLGAHTDAVLEGVLGIDADEIGSLRERGVVA